MKKIALVFLMSALWFVSMNVSLAQFEGKVVYNSFEIKPDAQKQKKDQFTMFITPQRILLQGKNRYDFIGNIKTEGILVRLDLEDFIFLTGSDNALKISKSDITSMMNMFGNQEEDDINTSIDYKRTGESQTIKGYACEKFVFTDADEADQYSEVWMTRDIQINWGMMAEPWGKKTEEMMSGDFPISLVFKEGYFPVKMESYKSGELLAVTEVEDLSRSSVPPAMVEVPSGVNVLSFQDYLFQKLSQQDH